MIGTTRHTVGSPSTVRTAPLPHQQIFHCDALGVRERQGIGLDRLIDRAPDLDDSETASEQTVGLFRKKLAEPIGARPLRVVVVRRKHRLAGKAPFPPPPPARTERRGA